MFSRLFCMTIILAGCFTICPVAADQATDSPPDNAAKSETESPALTLGTMFWGMKKIGSDYQAIVMQEGSVLNSGDGLKVGFKVNVEAYVFVLMIDSQGKGSVIFPHPDIATSNHVKAGQWVGIPPADEWFCLDENTGTETIYVLATVNPMPDIKQLIDKLDAMGAKRENAKADEEVVRFTNRAAVKRKKDDKKKKKKKKLRKPRKPMVIAGVVRGITGTKKGSLSRVKLKNGRVVEKASETISGQGAVIRALSFVHE
jgi:uncharacterized protein DUF4384